MKTYLSLLLVLAMVFCTGCSAAASAVQTTVPETASATTAAAEAGSYDLFEGETVDDSMTFHWAPTLQDKTLSRKLTEEILPQYVDTWFENGEILDQNILDNISDSASGWILIAGTPRQDMGWNSLERQGRTAYCRRIQVSHVAHSQDYHLEKTVAAPDLREPESIIQNNIQLHETVEDTGLMLPKIKRAELYVRSLKQCFVLRDPEKLAVLQKATTLPKQLRTWTFRGGLAMDGVGDPLILDLEGQGKRVFLTNPEDGGSDLWYSHFLLMPVSLYELFDVPLKAEGYSLDKNGNTQVLCQGMKYYESSHDSWKYQFTLDPRGNLIGCLDLTEYDDPDIRQRREEAAFTYDNQDRLTRKTWGRTDYQGFTEYAYDDQGRLCREETHHGQDYREAFTYEYDDQGRLTAKIGRSASGEEEPGCSYFFWYDDQGGKHVFWFDENGDPQGNPPETPLRKPGT